ncbi:MAG: sigma-70 family RNA polymerase sigma factor [Frankiaceae bacterium]|nr:sigma-70 family RNA polymerase sigma factor [Frankiaceae bacterium]
MAGDVVSVDTSLSAFESFYRSRIARTVRLAALLGCDDPENAAQEAMVRLHRRWSSFGSDVEAAAFLRRIVVNLSRDQWRRAQLRRRKPRFDLVTTASVEDAAVVREDHREVLAGIACLSTRQREAVVLRYWQDLAEAEVAAAMNTSVGSVKTHLSRAMRSLTQYLEVRR